MSQPATPSATERFAIILLCLQQAVGAQTGWGLSNPLIGLICNRLLMIKQGFARLAARLAAGTYVQRQRTAKPREATVAATAATEIQRKSRTKNPLPRKSGWLLPLIPLAVGYRSQLDYLFQDPEMAALLAAAPEAMRRPLRSLCHMLALPPPAILALPPRPPRPPKPRKPRPKRPPFEPVRRSTPEEAPWWEYKWPDKRPKWTLYRMCGRRGPR